MILFLAHPRHPYPASKLGRRHSRKTEKERQLASVSDPYPDSIGSGDPDPDWEVGFGSRQAKIGPQKGKFFRNFMFEESERPFVDVL
jgi:hypothetical protein